MNRIFVRSENMDYSKIIFECKKEITVANWYVT